MPDRPVHYNRVVSYEVYGERRQFVFRARFEERGSRECTDLIFEGVLAYRFESGNFGNIPFGVGEGPVAQLTATSSSLFEGIFCGRDHRRSSKHGAATDSSWL